MQTNKPTTPRTHPNRVIIPPTLHSRGITLVTHPNRVITHRTPLNSKDSTTHRIYPNKGIIPKTPTNRVTMTRISKVKVTMTLISKVKRTMTPTNKVNIIPRTLAMTNRVTTLRGHNQPPLLLSRVKQEINTPRVSLLLPQPPKQTLRLAEGLIGRRQRAGRLVRAQVKPRQAAQGAFQAIGHAP